MLNYKYIYVLDFCSGSIFELKLTTKEYLDKDIVDILDDYGLKENQCDWMISDKNLNIEHLTKNNKVGNNTNKFNKKCKSIINGIAISNSN